MVTGRARSFPESREAPQLEVSFLLTEKNKSEASCNRSSLANDRGMLFVGLARRCHLLDQNT